MHVCLQVTFNNLLLSIKTSFIKSEKFLNFKMIHLNYTLMTFIYIISLVSIYKKQKYKTKQDFKLHVGNRNIMIKQQQKIQLFKKTIVIY